jgi:hypothetical protein
MACGRDAKPPRRDRVEQALAGDRGLARRYELVRKSLPRRPQRMLGVPSVRMEKLFAAIDDDELMQIKGVSRRSYSGARELDPKQAAKMGPEPGPLLAFAPMADLRKPPRLASL